MLTKLPPSQCGRSGCIEQTELRCSECEMSACWKHMFHNRNDKKQLCLKCYLIPIRNGTYIKVHYGPGNKRGC